MAGDERPPARRRLLVGAVFLVVAPVALLTAQGAPGQLRPASLTALAIVAVTVLAYTVDVPALAVHVVEAGRAAAQGRAMTALLVVLLVAVAVFVMAAALSVSQPAQAFLELLRD